MTDQHPITPSIQLMSQWTRDWNPNDESLIEYLARQAAQWGANQELEACCEILRGEFNYHHLAEPLRDARRPKPKNLADKALDAFEVEEDLWPVKSPGRGERFDLIRRALKRLQELEGQSND